MEIPKKSLLLFLVVVAAVIGVSKLSDGSDDTKLPSDHAGGQVAETSAEKNARYEAEEEAKAEQEEELTYGLKEAPSEGLSQLAEDNPELAAEILGGREVQIFKTQFIVSYNPQTRCPNYVCWELTPERLKGDAERTDAFSGDPVLAEDVRVETEDYARSGYDRGHMCPAADNKNSKTAMMESFFMTNVCPQAHSLNSGDWNELESKCRTWAKQYGSIYICCGPIYDSKTPKTIGKRKGIKISVPDRFFKVIFALGKEPKAIGFIMPNDDVNKALGLYAVSVDKVEDITGFDFFFQIPADIQDKAEAECDPAAWGL